MINKFELRLGNSVLRDGKLFAVEIIHGSHLYKNWQPIPLNDEWLLKFGFVKKINNGSEYLRYYWDGDIMIYVDEDTNAMYLGDYNQYQDCKPFGLCEQKIQYVHTLQNLAFLLTGEELKIK